MTTQTPARKRTARTDSGNSDATTFSTARDGEGRGNRRATASGPRAARAATVTADAVDAGSSSPRRATRATSTRSAGRAAIGSHRTDLPAAEPIGGGTAADVAGYTAGLDGPDRPSDATSDGHSMQHQQHVHRGSAAGHPAAAADQADRNNRVTFSVPLFGTVRLPAGDELAFLGGVGALAVVGIIDWPVAVVLGAGHTLAAKHRGKVLREFGEALEEA